MKRWIAGLSAVLLLVFGLASPAPPLVAAAFASPARVELTWMSIANWYFKIGDKRIMMDAYITRVPGPPFFFAPPAYPNDQYAYTQRAHEVDVPSITRVRDAVLGNARLDYLIVGHSHFDHSWDTPTWAKLTGAQMIGGMSSCFQANAQGVSGAQCRSVNGGEKIILGDGITVRVIRFNHSGDASNPIQHFARELYRPPVPDAATGGLRAGVGEDYPNGGGSRAFLFTVDGADGQIGFFVQDSASAYDLDKDIVIDGVSYGAPLENLAAAMKDAGLTQVNAWIGTGGRAVAELIVPVIHPKIYIPNHWDGLFNPFWKGLPYPFKDEALKTYLDGQKIALLPEKQYFDTYVLTRTGVTMEPSHDVKRMLGFADTQPFAKAMLDAVTQVASTSDGSGWATEATRISGQAPCSRSSMPPSFDAKTEVSVGGSLKGGGYARSFSRVIGFHGDRSRGCLAEPGSGHGPDASAPDQGCDKDMDPALDTGRPSGPPGSLAEQQCDPLGATKGIGREAVSDGR